MLPRRGLAAALLATPALAQGRATTTLVVPFAPGGLTDALARLAAEGLTHALGATVVVENQVGGAGVVAARRVARARPDGQTLFVATASQLCVAPFTSNTDYTPEDFTPISALAVSPFVLVARSGLGAATLADLIALGRARPGALNYGSAGVGALTHLSMAVFLARAGIEATHIPYRGIAPAFTDLLAGTLDMISCTPAEAMPQLGNPAVRLLGVSGATRARQFPAVPAIAETLPGFDITTWNGIVGPKGMTPDQVAPLSDALRALARDPGFVAALDRMGVDPVDHDPAAFAAMIRHDAETWGALVRRLGVTVT